jgi:hypothetical protein
MIGAFRLSDEISTMERLKIIGKELQDDHDIAFHTGTSIPEMY